MHDESTSPPVASDTTTTELTEDDREWMTKRVTRDTYGQAVIGTQDRTRHWTHNRTPLHITPDSPSFHPVFEFLRRSSRQQEGWQAPSGVKVRSEWIWGVPEPLRAGLLALVDDIANQSYTAIETALSDVLYRRLHEQIDLEDYSDADKLAAFGAPTTIGAVLLALSEALDIDPANWLNAHDLALLRQTIA